MPNRKYLFYTRALSGGGAEWVWSQLASMFAARGDDVILAVDEAGEGDERLDERVRVEVLGRGNARSTLAAARLLRSFKPDAVLTAITSNGVKMAAAKLVAFSPAPLLVSFHGFAEHQTGKLSAIGYHGLPMLSRVASRIVGVSDELRTTLVEEWGADPDKTVRIYNPARTQVPVASEAELLARPPIVAGLGRLSAEKGFDLLIEAFAHVKTPGATLRIAGKGPERDRLQQAIQRLGLTDRAHLIGFADPAGVYAEARVCVVPSRTEAFGLVPVEALSAGLPLVVTDCGGPREIVENGRFGAIVPIRDSAAMAAAIDRALAQPGDPAPRVARAKAFSAEASLKAWSGLLDEVVEKV